MVETLIVDFPVGTLPTSAPTVYRLRCVETSITSYAS
jgi:hypothetical protein